MDHPSAHERLADLALEPARLAALDADGSPDAVALRAHLVSCRECATELAGWRSVYAAFSLAATSAQGEPSRLRDLEREPRAAPPELRDRVLGEVAGIEATAASRKTSTGAVTQVAAPDPGVVPGPGVVPPTTHPGPAVPSRRVTARLAWLAVAAAIVVAVVSGTVAVSLDRQLRTAQVEVAELASVTATLDRILGEPTHGSVALKAADGSTGGTLAWSPTEIAVITPALPAPTGGATYRCWIERGGTRTVVGTMSFAGETGYWAGSTGPWGGGVSSGDRFGVSLVPGDGGSPSPVLVAQL